MKLKTKKVEYFEVDYGDLEAFIEEVYGQEFNLACDQETGNDTALTMEVKKERLGEYDRDKIDRWIRDGEESYMFRVLMFDLCNKDLIEPGNYVIEISW